MASNAIYSKLVQCKCASQTYSHAQKTFRSADSNRGLFSMFGDPRTREKVYQRVATTPRETISYVCYLETEMLQAELSLTAKFDFSRHSRHAGRAQGANAGRPDRAPHRARYRNLHAIGYGRSMGDRVSGPTSRRIRTPVRECSLKKSVSAQQHPRAAEVLSLPLFQLECILHYGQGPASIKTLFTLVKYTERIPRDLIGPSANVACMIALMASACELQCG